MDKENNDTKYESSDDIRVQENADPSSESTDYVDDPASIDALLYDNDEELYTAETLEENAQFNDFLKEYNAIIRKNKKSISADHSEFPEQFSIFPEDDVQKKAVRADGDADSVHSEIWHEDITLNPETYADPDEEDNIFRDTPLKEEEAEDNRCEDEDDGTVTYTFDDCARAESAEMLPEEKKYDPDNPRIIDSVFDFVELFVLTLVAVMILTTFLFKHSVVEGSSMYSTLEDGDHLIISDAFYTPERGDIVVFEDYSTYLKKAVVKRVIGLPGETVEISVDSDGTYVVRINGDILEEDYDYTDVNHSAPAVGKWFVNKGEVFVMGDNRYNSTDSREIGPIDIDTILGKVILRFYPLNKFGGVD